MHKTLYFLTVLCHLSNSKAELVNVGLISDGDPEIECAFNHQAKITSLAPLENRVPQHDSLETLESVCDLLADGVAAIFGSSSEHNSKVIQAICDTKDIPHLETRWNDELSAGQSIVNLHPYPKILSRAYLDLVKFSDWKRFTVFYEDDEGLSRIRPLLELNVGDSEYSIIARRLDPQMTGNYRVTFKEAFKSGHRDFVLDCDILHLHEILLHAQQVGLMTSVYRYFITNLDAHTIDLESFRYGGTNIKGIRLINPNDIEIIDFATIIQEQGKNLANYTPTMYNNSLPTLRIQTALTADAVLLFSSAFNELKPESTKEIQCDSSESWEYGLSLISYIRMSTVKGLTGLIKLDHEGFRSDFSLEVTELKNGMVKIGNWSSSDGLKFDPIDYEDPEYDDGTLHNRTFKVIIALTNPYAMLKEDDTAQYGNDRFEGFGIDLIHELAVLEGFNYIFLVREDKSNGSYNKTTNSWSGMIGDVLNGIADLAITDLTITVDREEAVDFTSPFMTLGISILYQKPSKAPPNFFSFAEPFAFEVWACLSAACFAVSITLFVMGRLCPSEWTNPFPCIEEPKFLLNQFSLRNSFWFTIGSLMQQGSEIAPIGYSTRMMAGVWWFFTLIMVSSYTANLAACLALDNLDIPFSNVQELVARAEKVGIKYGAKKNGATANFFRDSDSEDYRKIFKYMEEHDDAMVSENEDGVRRAETEKYAFFMESTSIEYEIQRHCTLNQINGLLDEKGYGIAMRKHTNYRHLLNTALLKLQSSGTIQNLKRKWWEERRGGGQCVGQEENTEAEPLDMENLGGVFWVTFGGIVLAIVMVFIEMCLHVLKVSIKEKTSFRKGFKEELVFYFKFKGLVKTVKKEESRSKSVSRKSEEKTPSLPGILPDITKERST